MGRSRGATAAVAAALLLAACGGDADETADNAEETPSPQIMVPGEETEQEATEPGADDSGDDSAGQDSGPSAQERVAGQPESPFADASGLYEPRDGTWPVGDAGEVEFEADGDTVRLIDTRPAEGWEVSVDERGDDELEVDFVRDNARWEFEAEIDDGDLEIEIRQDLIPAEPGRFAVGDAGTVEIAVEDRRLRLVDVQATEGWRTEVEEDGDEVEVDFRRSGVRWDFEAEIDDGRLEVQIDLTVEGRAR